MNILVWGTGKLTTSYMKHGYFLGHEILAFVDTYARGKYGEYSIIKPEDIIDIKFDYVVVCVKEHNEDILKTCISVGVDLSKIIFINYYAGFGGNSSKYIALLPGKEKIRDVFPQLHMQMEGFRLQKEYMKENLKSTFKDKALIKELGDSHIVAWVPVELLFSERTKDVVLDDYTSAWKKYHAEWENHPIICLKPQRKLFEFFMKGEELPVDYYEWWNKMFTTRGINNGMTNEDIIEKRFREFTMMQNNLNKGMDFFIDNPSTGSWNQSGYFNLWDGHHRAAFLYHSGMRKIPVCVTKGDYEAWKNEESAKKVWKIIKKQERFEFYQPILNPYFIDIRSYREDFTKSRLHHILEYFGNKNFRAKNILDIGACLGYYGQMFARMGASVTMIEYDPIHYELLCELNRLMYVECNTVMKPFEIYESNETFDIAIMLTVFYPYMKNEALKKRFLEQIDKYVKHMLIWESGDKIEAEKEEIMRNTKFKYFRHLCYTYGTGKFRELGIFFDNENDIR